MIIDLPHRYRFELNPKDYAEVRNGVLHLHGNISFKKVVFNITFFTKGKNTCYYCGKTVKRKDITLDHMYAQFIGGPTIPNNLVPCCSKCNSIKSNLSAEQFKIYLSLKKEEREGYRNLVFLQQTAIKKRGGYGLPSDWITIKGIDNFITRIELGKKYRGKKYNKAKAYYKNYKTLPIPLVVDKNVFLLDGYISLMIAKEEGIKSLPVIVLENVIVHF